MHPIRFVIDASDIVSPVGHGIDADGANAILVRLQYRKNYTRTYTIMCAVSSNSNGPAPMRVGR